MKASLVAELRSQTPGPKRLADGTNAKIQNHLQEVLDCSRYSLASFHIFVLAVYDPSGASFFSVPMSPRIALSPLFYRVRLADCWRVEHVLA
ncbi:MAG: hypothetical protein ACFCU3_00815 [Verrucomicrobiales bacterium]